MREIPPLVSVIMPVYRESIKFLKESIESVLKQTYRNIEFLIGIDDPSNYEIIEFISNYAKKDSRIVIHINPVNYKQAKTKNILISKSKGEFIAFLDADDICVPSRIEKQVEFLLRNSEIYLVGCGAYIIDENSEIVKTFMPPATEKCIREFLLNGIMPMAHSSWMVRREAFEKIGFFKEILVEDFEFLLRCLSQGFKISNIKESLIYYRVHFSKSRLGISKSVEQIYSVKYCIQMFKKNNLDGVNEEALCGYIKSSKSIDLLKYLHKISLQSYYKALKFYQNDKKIIAFFYLIVSFISPLRVKHYVKILKLKLKCQKDYTIPQVYTEKRK